VNAVGAEVQGWCVIAEKHHGVDLRDEWRREQQEAARRVAVDTVNKAD